MKRTTVSTKGQIVLPKEIREKRHWAAGTKLVIEERPEGVLLKAERRRRTGSIADLAGTLKYDGPPHTVEEMNGAIVEEIRRRYARRRY